MQVIWKFKIENIYDDDRFELQLPQEYGVLHVASQKSLVSDGRLKNDAYMWIQMDPDAPRRAVQFRVVMTGEQFEGGDEYIGTFMLSQEGFVGHVFKVFSG